MSHSKYNEYVEKFIKYAYNHNVSQFTVQTLLRKSYTATHKLVLSPSPLVNRVPVDEDDFAKRFIMLLSNEIQHLTDDFFKED